MTRAGAALAILLAGLAGCGKKAGPDVAVKAFFDDLSKSQRN